jgi:hypothetical protein
MAALFPPKPRDVEIAHGPEIAVFFATGLRPISSSC